MSSDLSITATELDLPQCSSKQCVPRVGFIGVLCQGISGVTCSEACALLIVINLNRG